MNELENIKKQEQKVDRKICFTKVKKLHKILQNLKRYKLLDMLLRMVQSQ